MAWHSIKHCSKRRRLKGEKKCERKRRWIKTKEGEGRGGNKIQGLYSTKLNYSFRYCFCQRKKMAVIWLRRPPLATAKLVLRHVESMFSFVLRWYETVYIVLIVVVALPLSVSHGGLVYQVVQVGNIATPTYGRRWWGWCCITTPCARQPRLPPGQGWRNIKQIQYDDCIRTLGYAVLG